jgi:hypothetical protein
MVTNVLIEASPVKKKKKKGLGLSAKQAALYLNGLF